MKLISTKFFLTLILLTVMMAAGSQDSRTNYISKSFDEVRSVEMRLYAKNIQCRVWNKTQVRLLAIVSATEAGPSLEDEAWLSLSGIDVQLHDGKLSINDRNYINLTPSNLKTSGLTFVPGKKYIARERSGYFYFNGERLVPLQDVWHGPEKKTINRKYLEMSLILMLPSGIPLDLEDDYGQISFAHNMNKATVKGDHLLMIAQNIDHLNLTTAFSNISLIQAEEANITCEETTLFVDSTGTCSFNSSGSILNIGSARSLSLKSSSDDYVTRSVGSISGTMKNGRFFLNRLLDSLDMTAEGMNLRVNRVGPRIKKFILQNTAALMSFGMGEVPGYIIHLSGKSYATISSEGTGYRIIDKRRDKGSEVSQYTVGAGNRFMPVFRISGDNCTTSFQ